MGISSPSTATTKVYYCWAYIYIHVCALYLFTGCLSAGLANESVRWPLSVPRKGSQDPRFSWDGVVWMMHLAEQQRTCRTSGTIPGSINQKLFPVNHHHPHSSLGIRMNWVWVKNLCYWPIQIKYFVIVINLKNMKIIQFYIFNVRPNL